MTTSSNIKSFTAATHTNADFVVLKDFDPPLYVTGHSGHQTTVKEIAYSPNNIMFVNVSLVSISGDVETLSFDATKFRFRDAATSIEKRTYDAIAATLQEFSNAYELKKLKKWEESAPAIKFE